MRRLHRTIIATLLCLAMLLTVAMAGCDTRGQGTNKPSTNPPTIEKKTEAKTERKKERKTETETKTKTEEKD